MTDSTETDDTRSTLEAIRCWSARLTWLLTGAGLGAAVTALVDPRPGPERRHELRDRAASLAREGAGTLRDRAGHAARSARGAAAEAVGSAVPDVLQRPSDPKTLRQRIRSEVIGQIPDADDVVVVVHEAGQITLKGTVGSPEVEQALVEATRRVPGARQVEARLTVRR